MVTETSPNSSFLSSREFTKKASELRHLVQELAESAPDAAKEQLLSLKDGLASFCAEGGCSLSSVTNRVVATVRAHPVPVAAAAVGAGLITWWLLSRR